MQELQNTFAPFQSKTNVVWLGILKRSVHEGEIDGVIFPGFPDEAIQRQTIGSAGEHAITEAFGFYNFSNARVKSAGNKVDERFHILDFGACWGRIARCFYHMIAPSQITGLEIQDKWIDEWKRIGAPSPIRKVDPVGHADIADRSADLITAYSVFSHLDQYASDFWAAEFARLLKPGGLLIATTQGERFIDECVGYSRQENLQSDWHRSLAESFPDPEGARKRYLAGALVASKPYAPHYGETLMPPGYIMREWGHMFELLEFHQARHTMRQSIFVLRKQYQNVS